MPSVEENGLNCLSMQATHQLIIVAQSENGNKKRMYNANDLIKTFRCSWPLTNGQTKFCLDVMTCCIKGLTVGQLLPCEN